MGDGEFPRKGKGVSIGGLREGLQSLLAEMEAKSQEPIVCQRCQGQTTIGDSFNGICPKCRVEVERQESFKTAVERLPRRFRPASLEDIKDGDYDGIKMDLVQAYENRQSLYHYGTTGNGKSTLHAAFYRRAAWEMRPVDWVVIPELLEILRGAYSSKQDVMDMINWYVRVSREGLLFVEDLGSEYIKPTKNGDGEVGWVEEKLYLLFDRIYQGEGRVWVTSNIDLDSLSGRVGERIASRIQRMCLVLKNGFPDYSRIPGGDR